MKNIIIMSVVVATIIITMAIVSHPIDTIGAYYNAGDTWIICTPRGWETVSRDRIEWSISVYKEMGVYGKELSEVCRGK